MTQTHLNMVPVKYLLPQFLSLLLVGLSSLCMALTLSLELLSGVEDPKTGKTDPPFPKVE